MKYSKHRKNITVDIGTNRYLRANCKYLECKFQRFSKRYSIKKNEGYIYIEICFASYICIIIHNLRVNLHLRRVSKVIEKT